MWEILTFGARPYGDQTTKDVIIYIDRGNRLSQPATCTLELYSSMLSCESICIAMVTVAMETPSYFHLVNFDIAG